MVGNGGHSRSVESCIVAFERVIRDAAEPAHQADRLRRLESGRFYQLWVRRAAAYGPAVGSALFAGGVRVLGLASVPLFRPWATGSNGHDKAAYTQHGGRMAVGGTRIVRPNPPIKPTASGV